MTPLQQNDIVTIKIDDVVVTAKICLVATNGYIVEFYRQGKRCLDFINNTNLVPA